MCIRVSLFCSCQVLNRFKIAESLNHRSWALYKAYPSIFNVDNNSKKRKLEEGVRKETSTPKPAVPLTNTAVLPIASPIVAVTSKPKLSISKPKSATTMPNNDAIISSKQQGSGLSLKQKSVEAVHNPPTAPAAPATTIAPPIPTSDTFTAKPVDPLTQLAEAAIKAVELPVVQETVAVAAEQSKQQVEAAKECKEVISFDQDDSSEANVDENEDGTENAATTTPAAVLGSPIDNTVEVNEVQQPL